MRSRKEWIELTRRCGTSRARGSKDQEAQVDHGKISAYKVNLKVTFVLEGEPV